jgi:hypothetical protein
MNFKETFPNSNIIFCIDNISDELHKSIESIKDRRDTFWVVDGGTQTKAFRKVLELILDTSFNLGPQLLIQEDDYLYLPGAEQKMLEALEYGHYVTGYLHPDKFMDPSRGGNPSTYAENISEETRVIKTESSFWMMTNSTTGTFATTKSVLAEDRSVWLKYSENRSVTEDYNAFLELRKRGRSVLMPIPTLSTHAMSEWLAPLTGTSYHSWNELIKP